jgi:mono/diheme cytochrome c family protein
MRSCFAFVLGALLLAGLPACNHASRTQLRTAAVQTEMPANVGRGRAIYQARCAACHGRDGTGGQVGPALRNESLRRTAAAVRAIILQPEPPMPKLFPVRLSASDVRDVSAYVETL